MSDEPAGRFGVRHMLVSLGPSPSLSWGVRGCLRPAGEKPKLSFMISNLPLFRGVPEAPGVLIGRRVFGRSFRFQFPPLRTAEPPNRSTGEMGRHRSPEKGYVISLGIQSYLLRRHLDPPGTHPSPTF